MSDINGNKWEKGDVVQIDPEHDPVFGGCFMVVTEPKPWGAQGYCDGPAPADKRGLAYYRLAYINGVKVGHAEWVNDTGEETGTKP